MKVYTAYFDGLYIGGSALIIAESKEEAFKMVVEEMEKEELFDGQNKSFSVEDIEEIDTSHPHVAEFANGDY